MSTAPVFHKPRCCDSFFFHKPDCSLVHPEIAALPSKMPREIRVRARKLKVEITTSPAFSSLPLVTPAEARAVARKLLLAADEAERSFIE